MGESEGQSKKRVYERALNKRDRNPGKFLLGRKMQGQDSMLFEISDDAYTHILNGKCWRVRSYR